jgi:hypothetical protein
MRRINAEVLVKSITRPVSSVQFGPSMRSFASVPECNISVSSTDKDTIKFLSEGIADGDLINFKKLDFYVNNHMTGKFEKCYGCICESMDPVGFDEKVFRFVCDKIEERISEGMEIYTEIKSKGLIDVVFEDDITDDVYRLRGTASEFGESDDRWWESDRSQSKEQSRITWKKLIKNGFTKV